MTLRTLIAITALLFSFPAKAADCVWQTEDGAVLFEADPMHISVIEGGETRSCTLRGAGTGVALRVATCGDEDWAYFTIPSVPGGLYDILIFQNAPWYRACGDDRR